MHTGVFSRQVLIILLKMFDLQILISSFDGPVSLWPVWKRLKSGDTVLLHYYIGRSFKMCAIVRDNLIKESIMADNVSSYELGHLLSIQGFEGLRFDPLSEVIYGH